MTDPCPLIQNSIHSSEQQEAHTARKALMSLDDAIEMCVGGGITSAQWLQAFILSIAWIFDAQQSFISVFTDRRQTWHCTRSDDKVCSLASTPCSLPSGSWEWDQPVQTSVVSEWALECTSPFASGLPASAFFAGSLVGGLSLATLGDSSLGRKKTLFYSCLLMSSVGILTTMSPNIWVYAALRFLNGFGRATIGNTALVLSTETVANKWRGQIGIIGFLTFTLGFLSLPAMAFLCRRSSWKILYLLTSVPALCYSILIHFFVRESPRWLIVHGRREEAIQTLLDMSSSRSNNGIRTQQISHTFSDVLIITTRETWNVDMYSSLKILVEKSWAFRRLAAIMISGFGIGTVYYGMPLAIGNLGGFNLYLSVTFNALAEFPAALLTFFLIGSLNRKGSVVACTTVSGICSVLCTVITGDNNKGLRMGMEVVSFFSACTAFNVVLIYAMELFPTSVRNSALSMVRQAIVLGAVFAPILVVICRDNEGGLLSFGVFGLVIGSCGFFVLCLPETRGGGICDTMEEEESKNQEVASSNQGGFDFKGSGLVLVRRSNDASEA